MPAVPDRFTSVRFANGNRTASDPDKQHGPLVIVQPAESRDFIVLELTGCETIASHGAGGERERLPGVPDIVQAIAISPVAVLPRFAPRNAGQDEYDGRIDARDSQVADREIADGPLLGHMGRGPVVIQPVGPVLEAARKEMEFGRVQVPRGG